ncbi:MAG: hypothetical protein WDO69_09700 [Pseudomonadota bacterium]
MRTALVLPLMLALCPLACATYREDLIRGQRMYEENQYEHALALWRILEDDTDSLSATDQTRYAYLRGMTDYRLGFRADSRHWLAIAKVSNQAHAGGLNAAWQERLEESLTDLNQDVYGAAEANSSHAIEYGKAGPSDEVDAGTSAGTGTGTGTGTGSEVPRPPSQRERCSSNADCKTGEICDGKSCTPL